MQLAFLVKQELSASVGRTLQEVVETLVVLHKKRLDELTGAVVEDLQVTTGVNRVAVELESLRFIGKNIHAKFLARPRLRVFVEGHQLVLAEDGQFQLHAARIRYCPERRLYLEDEIVFRHRIPVDRQLHVLHVEIIDQRAVFHTIAGDIHRYQDLCRAVDAFVVRQFLQTVEVAVQFQFFLEFKVVVGYR